MRRKICEVRRKHYKMFYIGGFIRKTIKESISSKEFKKLINYTRGREDLI